MSDELHERRDDMSRTGKLSVTMDDDGDVIIAIVKFEDGPERGPHDGWVTLEFCSGMAGGGRSFHTRNALIALRDAIDKDNEERPIT